MRGVLRPLPVALLALLALARPAPAGAQTFDDVDDLVRTCTMIFTARTEVEPDGRLVFELLEPIRGLYEPGLVGELLPDGRFRLSAEASASLSGQVSDGDLAIHCYSPLDRAGYNRFERPTLVLTVRDDVVTFPATAGPRPMQLADLRSAIYTADRANPLHVGPGEYLPATAVLELSACDDAARRTAAEQLRHRLDALGVLASVVEDGSLLRVEGAWPRDPAAMLAELVRPGRLSFHRVRDDLMVALVEDARAVPQLAAHVRDSIVELESGERAVLEAFVAARPVEGHTWAIETSEDPHGGERFAALLLAPPVTLGLTEVHLETDPRTGRPRTALDFDAAGATAFAELTTRLVDQRMAIAFDGEVMASPLVMEPITGGTAVLDFGGSSAEVVWARARGAAAALRTGELACPVAVDSVTYE